ncbi:LVIVD repeat-containing protein [Candidatus Lokiarchaeum ossiferum]|uniref:LVIVD repeat-containing protein n=1 Tax=Candidatus Lokiarchaeum ossiferum TaxID=2951803 RepID=UPI00352D86C5
MKSTLSTRLLSQPKIARFLLGVVIILSMSCFSIQFTSAAQGSVEVKRIPIKMELIDDSLLICAEDDRGLEIFNISNVNKPVKVADYFYPQTTTNLTYPWWDFSYARDFVVQDQYLYIASSAWGLEIVDISDPSNPTQAGRYDDGGSVGQVFIHGTMAYTLDRRDQIEVINVSIPSVPVKVGEFHLASEIYENIRTFTISMDYPFIYMYINWANNTHGIEGVNLTDYTKDFMPFNASVDCQNPEYFDTTHWYDYEWVRDGDHEFWGMGVLNEFGQTTGPNLFKFNDYLIMSRAWSRANPPTIKLYNISSPLQPIEIGECLDVLEEAWNLIYFRNILFTVGREIDNDWSAIYTINITDPIHATETDDLEAIQTKTENVGSFDLSETKICLSNIEKRLKILSLIPGNTVIIIGGISIISIFALSMIVFADRRRGKSHLI